MSESSRYVIGIDLGTTNSSVSYVDTTVSPHIQSLRIPQHTQNNLFDSLPTLPSFCYQQSNALPWIKNRDYLIGTLAQALGAKTPTKLIESAKSWLCNVAANRRDKILPIESADESQRISPIEATSRYLNHIREAWNHQIGQGDPSCEFEQQEIVLTVPASFDEVARMLTVESAKMAGFLNLTLLEEPQAAFYHWISQYENSWKHLLKSGDSILVCDVGGGTTDFSLIEVVAKEGQLSFQRMAVGDHLLLGGDNMDAAIAHFLETKLLSQGISSLETAQWLQLKHQAREAKELLLSGIQGPFKVLIQGKGSGVIQGSLATEISQEDLEHLLIEGFFKQTPWDEALKLRKAGGIKSMGLPYEAEPSILKHLAHFLQQNTSKKTAEVKPPDYILFNGAALKPKIFQNAILDSLKIWFPEKNPQILDSSQLDLAVSKGAAYFGKVKQGLGTRIGGGIARGFYLKVEIQNEMGAISHQALTLLPRGAEEGCSYEPKQTFLLQSNTPVSFNVYSSHVRLNDQSGSFIPIDSQELQPLPPIHTVLRYGKKGINPDHEKIPVKLGIKLTEIGTLELWLSSQKSDHKWFLEFQIRTSSGEDHASHSKETFDREFGHLCKEVIKSAFNGVINPNQIMEQLELQIGSQKKDWPIGLLRELGDAVLKEAPNRHKSPIYAARWWNLIGFFLRPGKGYPLDDFRIKELWKIILADMKLAVAPEVQLQVWICYRRIASGLNKGQQMQLCNLLLPDLLTQKSDLTEVKNKKDQYGHIEKIRAISALELLEIPLKIRLGQAFLKSIQTDKATDSHYMALARIGARNLLYGSVANIIPKDICTNWVESLLKVKNNPGSYISFILAQIAKKNVLREFSLPDHIVNQAITYIQQHPHPEKYLTMLNGSEISQNEQEILLGDQLPVGLTLSTAFALQGN